MNKQEFQGKYYLCLTELDYRDLISRLKEMDFRWVSGEELTEADLENWNRLGSSTVLWLSPEGIRFISYSEAKYAGVQVETWNIR